MTATVPLKSLLSEIDQTFSPQGPLAQQEGYRYREGQVELARSIAQAIVRGERLVAEAGTGVGKTFAYLVPALLSGRRCMVSTASRALQDQLFLRDLPGLCARLGLHPRIERLKGRANYFCPYRIRQLGLRGQFSSPKEAADYREVVREAARSSDGDIMSCPSIPENATIWPLVTSTADNCLGSNCPDYEECPVVAARARAAEAQLVVINHHLLCADWALQAEGIGDFLPQAEVVILDEAHNLDGVATQFFGQIISTTGLQSFGRDLSVAGAEHAADGADWGLLLRDLEGRLLRLRTAVPATLSAARRRWTDLTPQESADLREALEGVSDWIDQAGEILRVNSSRHAELDRLAQRRDLLAKRLVSVQTDQEGGVRWLEPSRTGLSLHWAPIDLSDQLAPRFHRADGPAWILVSATLSTHVEDPESGFDHFTRQLGLRPEHKLCIPSPFDYPHQSLLVVPEGLPDPKQTEAILGLLNLPGFWPLLSEVPGGIFILCTSHRAVNLAAEWLQAPGRLSADRQLLVQGRESRDRLLKTFRTHGRAVLVGSASFWEGVDVPGLALAAVVIDRLPFAPPDDPVTEGRMADLQARGLAPFIALQLPEATLTLKQGVGRLIRSETDRGLLVVGDRRLAETPYGRRMLRSLPPFRRTRRLEEARKFVEEIREKPL